MFPGRQLLRYIAVTSALLLAAAIAAAQTTTAIIEGTVFDGTGAVVPAVAIAVQGGTVTRTMVSDARGFYRALALPPGQYVVIATLAGFQSLRIENIDVALNRTATVDLRMEVAPQTASVDVRPFVPLINAAGSATAHVVSRQQIESLPLNDRNYLALVQTTPGVIVNETARSEFGDRDTRGAILGERAGNAAFLIDGFENNDDFRGGVFQAYTQDAIQEFEVIAAGYTAEFGRGSGGVINAIARSGTDEVKGSGFLFLRNDLFDASNVAGSKVPDLARYNAGATIGGPVSRGRSWYFGSFEHIFERRQAIFPPGIPSILEKREDFVTRPEAETSRMFGKYSRRLSAANELRAEASWSRLQNVKQLASAIALPSASNDNDTRTFLGAVTYTSIRSPRLMLESSLGYRDQRFAQNQNLGDGVSDNVTVGGFMFEFGPRYASKQTLNQRYFTARQTASLFVRDRHAAKIGVEYVRTAVNGSTAQDLINAISTSGTNLERYDSASFSILQGVGFDNPADQLTRMNNDGVSLFAQDGWRVGTSLTFNVGLRYDYDSKFGDSNNVAPRLGVTWAPDARTALHASWGLFYDRYRLGLAQAVPELGGFNGRTIVELDYPRLAADAAGTNRPGWLAQLRAGGGDRFVLQKHFGISEDALVTRETVQALTGLTPAQFLTELRTFLAGLGTFLPVDFSPTTGYLRQDLSAAYKDQIRVARPFKTPYNSTFTVGGERTLSVDLSVGATYVHRLIHNILGVQLTNLAFDSRRENRVITTDDGPLQRSYGPWYSGDYDALILSVDKRFNKRYQLQINYTYARGRDNLANANLALGVGAQGAGAVPTDNLDLGFDRGNSDLLVPHALVASGIVTLPVGFSMSGVFRAASGSFFSATQSSSIDYDGDGIGSFRPRGTVRNQFQAPATTNADLRIEKRFVFGRYTAAALVEWFNLLNARNARLIDKSYTDPGPGTDARPTATFGSIRTPLPGREMQLGLRLMF